jgi:hypothetical protein
MDIMSSFFIVVSFLYCSMIFVSASNIGLGLLLRPHPASIEQIEFEIALSCGWNIPAMLG